MLTAVTELDAADQAEPSAADTALLDHLPYLALNLTHAPEPLLRPPFETTQLTVVLNGDGDEVTITIKLLADDLPDIAHAAERTTETRPSAHKMPAHTAGAGSVDAIRALGRASQGWERGSAGAGSDRRGGQD